MTTFSSDKDHTIRASSHPLFPELTGTQIGRRGVLPDSFSGRLTVISGANDATAQYFVNYLKQLNKPFAWLTFDAVLSTNECSLDNIVSGLNSASGIYFRDAIPILAEEELVSEVLRFTTLCHKKGIAASRLSTNFSKPLHLLNLSRVLANTIVRIPETFLSNSLQKKSSDWIVKGSSNLRSIALASNDPKLKEIRTNSAQVYLFQKKIVGQNIRVHVLDKMCFAISIKTSEIDYRYAADIRIDLVNLPDNVIKWCQAAAQAEGLVFAGIDLIRTLDGKFFVLEVNPNPGYHWFEKFNPTGTKPISNALVSYLTG